MRNFLLLLLASASLYAAESALILSDEVIAFGDQIVASTIKKVQEDATEPLTGSVYESYLYLHEAGFKNVLLKDVASVVKASGYLTALSDNESEYEVVRHAIAAFEGASVVSKSTEQENFVTAWARELKLSFEALKVVAEKDLPEDFSRHPISAQLILLNNGKFFSADCMAAFKGGLLASLAGYEKRKQAMGGLDLIQAVRERAYFVPAR
jgi:hypothetical protein